MTEFNKSVSVFGREAAEKLSAVPNVVFISISTPGQGYRNQISEDGWLEFLSIKFHDFVEPEHAAMLPDGIMFSKDMAQQILTLLSKHTEASVVVHCDAGVSRSVAVGAFMRDFLGYSLYLNEVSSDRSRNIHVYNVLRRLFRGVE